MGAEWRNGRLIVPQDSPRSSSKTDSPYSNAVALAAEIAAAEARGAEREKERIVTLLTEKLRIWQHEAKQVDPESKNRYYDGGVSALLNVLTALGAIR